MAHFTRSAIQARGHERAVIINDIKSLASCFGQSVISVFLSHSHKDADLIEGLIVILRSQGVEVYVDWKDGEMPAETSAVTAARIRGKIRENDRFIVVLTENSRASLWVPWELGVADVAKGSENIAIWPIREDREDLDGIEFMGVYPKIEDLAGLIGMSGPARALGRLDDWLRGS